MLAKLGPYEQRLCPACAEPMDKTGAEKRVIYSCTRCGMKITVLPGKE